VRFYLEKTHHKKGLEEWLKLREHLPSKFKALSLQGIRWSIKVQAQGEQLSPKQLEFSFQIAGPIA
jgi:hypothetical protein